MSKTVKLLLTGAVLAFAALSSACTPDCATDPSAYHCTE